MLILTARGEDVDKILGLEIGADDSCRNPSIPVNSSHGIRAILRRSARPAVTAGPLIVDGIRLDPSAREAWKNGTRLELTSIEFTLLEALLRDAGRVLTRESLTETVLGRKLAPFDRVIDVHISNLRKKLGSAPEGERIKAVRGSGYLYVVRSTSP